MGDDEELRERLIQELISPLFGEMEPKTERQQAFEEFVIEAPEFLSGLISEQLGLVEFIFSNGWLGGLQCVQRIQERNFAKLRKQDQ